MDTKRKKKRKRPNITKRKKTGKGKRGQLVSPTYLDQHNKDA